MVKTSFVRECPSVISVNGKIPDVSLSICTDTRHYRHPAMFIAYPGAKFNPLDMIAPLLEQGCPVLVYQQDPANEAIVKRLLEKFPKTTFVAVKDSVVFSQELAHKHANSWRAMGKTIFAISGSNGKTTHKEMLAHLLRAKFGTRVVATEKNNNNHLGVPLTLFNLAPDSEVCVLELGSNHPGEIKVLCDIAAPNAGLVTNIGATHMEFFGTEEKVFEEEGWLYHSINSSTKGSGFFLQNLDDKFLCTLKRFKGVETFSLRPGADFHIIPDTDGVRITGKLSATLVNPHITGTHNKQNMAVAWIIASTLFPADHQIFSRAAADFRPTKNRSEWTEYQDKKIYLDAYNANPSSMKVALEGFFDWVKQQGVAEENTLLVLGDMNELGDGAPNYHKEVGEFLKRWGATTPVFIGKFAQHYVEGLGRGQTFTEAAKFKGSSWQQMTQGKTHIFIKGSRSLQLESLLAIT